MLLQLLPPLLLPLLLLIIHKTGSANPGLSARNPSKQTPEPRHYPCHNPATTHAQAPPQNVRP